MDAEGLAALLKRTLVQETRMEAEAELDKVKKIIGFCPGLLRVVMTPDLEQAVRQSAVIFFKNMIGEYWQPKEQQQQQQQIQMAFAVHEQDKAMVRESLVEAVAAAPEVIRIQLAVCVSMILKHDFPHRWPEVVDRVSICLQTPEQPGNWAGALTVLYQLVKNYEYRKKEERAPLNDAMNLLLPFVFEAMARLLDDRGLEATCIKKLILKIYYALTQFLLPLELINRDFFTKWMEVLRRILEQDIPAQVQADVEEDDRPQLIWWKEKKWAMHILTRFFERYGSPGNVAVEYKEFSEWYLKTFSQGILTSIFKVLDAYRRGVYVSPRVMQQALNYVNTGVSHAATWKFIKLHILEIIKDIVFPIMSYSESDAVLWETDPYEYVRIKFDIFEDFVSPSTAAQTLLHSVCKKRKDVLPKTMSMLTGVVQDASSTPAQKDGALHMIGTLADILLKQKIYKEQMEQFLVSIVFPEFSSPHGHLRARACWMLHYFADVRYKNPAILDQSFRLTIASLLKENEDIPVKVEAAIALQMMLTRQGDNAKKYVEPQIREITLELLKIIRETENDDLTSVMQKIVYTYTDQLLPVAVDMCNHLVETFALVLESGDSGDDKAITAMGLLNTIGTILTVMEDREDVHAQLEPIVLRAVNHVFTNSIMEFYEEALSLTCDLTTKKVSLNMWEMLKVIYQVFEKDGLDYFVDMMPSLHNYVTVDTDQFLSSRDYPMALFNMSKKVLESDNAGEDPQCHAAKLLEVIILQCKGKNIDELIPVFVELAFVRLSREIKTSELRTMCLQVAISAMYYDASLFFNVLQNRVNVNHPPTADVAAIIKNFIGQWIQDTDCFIGLHDRKVCVLGLCQLMTMPQLPGLGELAPRILPSLILLFDGLKHAYEAQKESDDSDDSSDDEDDDEDGGEGDLLESDEDEIDEDSATYLESLGDKIKKSVNGTGMQVSIEHEEDSEEDDDDDDEDDEYDGYEETSLDLYTTPLDDEDCPVDEYQIFKQIMQSLESENSAWYHTLISSVSDEDKKALQDVFILAGQRLAAKESKNIEKAGGYKFSQQTVPGQFNFSTSSGGEGNNFTFGNSS